MFTWLGIYNIDFEPSGTGPSHSRLESERLLGGGVTAPRKTSSRFQLLAGDEGPLLLHWNHTRSPCLASTSNDRAILIDRYTGEWLMKIWPIIY